MAQQTLEEAAKDLYPIEYTGRMFMPNRDELNNSYKQEAFIAGAKWQQEQDKKCYHPLPYRLAKSDFNFECTLCGKFI